MRILRLRVRDYRGIAEREVAFAPRGVTVVSGPNEIGKSSLAEAIDLLFDELDSTTKQRVRDVQPVDRDAGAEIEVDVETGPYAFTYAKRFQRKARTRLSLTRPRVENWTGREAHQRVRQILEETIDTDLWRALRVQQGEGLVQASWLGSPKLLAALDRAAGAACAAREETLLEAAEKEHARYFTPTGRERRELVSAVREVERAREREEEARRELEQLEEDVARAEELRMLCAACERTSREAEQALRELEQAFEPVDALREALATAEAQRASAQAEEREALQRARQRGQLVASHAAAEADLAQRAEEMEGGEPALLGARAELEHAERALRASRDAQDEAARRTAAQRRDLEFHRTAQELALLSERRRRIERAEQAVAEAQAELRGDALDEAALREIRDAERAVERAKSRLETEGPLVRITPETTLLHASLDGEPLPLSAGETREHRVTESLQLTVPGVAEISLVAGAGAAERAKALEQARTRWRDRCAEHGVESHADAVRSFARRQESERRLAEQRALRDQLLEHESMERLDARIRALDRRSQHFESERGELFAPPGDAEAAEARLAECEARQERARLEHRDAERRRDELLERHRRLAEQHRETAVRFELAQQSFRDQAARLEQARQESSDEALRDERERRSALARRREQAAQELARELAAHEPEQMEARLAGARRERESAARQLARVRDEATRIAARLEVRGQAGLHERLETARAEHERARRQQRSLSRRAAAARRLLTTLREERDALRRGYADPLARRIEELGRHVFGDDFRVELDDELRVARRIQQGRSLRFDQLSAGAREQIALLARLAVATLVAEDGGAPLIVDDALGHSDPQRLARIGRALSAAAPHCQILVLTCSPERYRHVERAHAVQLA